MQASMAEQALIGCLLLAPQKAGRYCQRLKGGMFREQTLGAVFDCFKALQKSKTPVDIVTVEAKLGSEYRTLLLQCAELAPSPDHVEEYAAIVLDCWREREMVTEALSIAQSSESAKQLAARFKAMADRQQQLEAALADENVKGFGTAAAEFLQTLGGPSEALKTGWEQFDRLLGGLCRKSVVVIAARPGRGKTDFALQLATQAARSCKVSYNTMEMPASQLLARVASRAAHIDSAKLRDRTLTGQEQTLLKQVLEQYSRKLQIHFDEEPAITPELVEGKIAKYHPDILVIDHLGLMGFESQKKTQWEQVAQTTHRLKAIALRQNVCILELVQLNRRTDERRAGQGDLYGGAAVEQDADVVIALETEPFEGSLKENQFVPVEVTVLKNRLGRTGKLQFAWQPQYHSYRPLQNAL